MKYLSKEQQLVVERRAKDGYQIYAQKNGYIACVKNKHTMLVNGLGYDTYVPHVSIIKVDCE